MGYAITDRALTRPEIRKIEELAILRHEAKQRRNEELMKTVYD